MPGMPPQQMMPVMVPMGETPLDHSILAQQDPQTQKNLIGERLYPLIAKLRPDLAPKITGMLLEMDNSELLMLLDDAGALGSKVDEAISVLNAHRGPPRN
jgi:polyadenylate-binding protein